MIHRTKADERAGRGRLIAGTSPAKSLRSAGVVPSKARGQNFLVQGGVASRIVSLAELEHGDEVVEIGPGLGILTERLLAAPISQLHLVEVDHGLAARLRQRLTGSFDLIEADFLKLDLRRIVVNPPVKIIGNLPFNVAAAILRRLGEAREMISRMVLMFQREVGERLRATADEPAYGALSVLTALDWQITDHFRIEAGSFHPRPKVDAEVLCFVPRREQLCPAQLRPAVIEVIRAGFAVRRKNLRNALAAGLRIDPQLAEQALHQAGIASAQRAERLSVHDFVEVAAALARCSGHLKPVPDA